MSIGKRIKELRINSNLTQRELADKLGVTDKAVSKWESEAGDPNISTLADISDLFEISLDELIKGEEKDSQDEISILEKIVKNGKDVFLNKMLKNGVKLNSVDEYGKDIIDYMLEYRKTNLITHLIESKVLILENGFFTINTAKAKVVNFNYSDYTDDSYQVKRTQFLKYSKRHRDLFMLLIENKEYELIKSCMNFRSSLPNKRGKGTTTFLYLGLGRIEMKYTESELEIICSSNDTKLIHILTGFDNVVHPSDYDKIAKGIKSYSKTETQLQFIKDLVQYNQKAKEHNENLYELETRYIGNKQVTTRTKKDQQTTYYRINQLKFYDWMPKVALQDKKILIMLAPFITDEIMTEDLMHQIAKIVDLNYFSDSLSYKSIVTASSKKGNDFLKYIVECYERDYNKFPIIEVLKRVEEFPELEHDVIAFVFKYKKSAYPLVVPNKRFQMSGSRGMRNESFNFRIKRGHSLVFNEPTHIPKRELPPKFSREYTRLQMNLKLDNLLQNLVKYLSKETLEIVLELFYKQEKEAAMLKLVQNNELESIRKFIISDNLCSKKYQYYKVYSPQAMGNRNYTYHFAIKSKDVLSELSKKYDILNDVVDILDTETIDMILNQYCDDSNFKLMALLIDHGGMLYSSYMTTEDDGWGYMVDVTKSKKDPKKTAVMREMIRQFK